MEWWGPARRIDRVESADELQFQVVKLRRKAEAAASILLGVLALVALVVGQVVVGFTLAMFAVVSIVSWYVKPVRRLVVTESGMRGDPQSAAWSEVFELQFGGGGDEGPPGLYARTTIILSRCVLGGINKAEADDIKAAIEEKWPSLRMAPRPEGIWSEIKKSLVGGR